MPKQKDRVIIDTNIWISFLVSRNYSKLDKILGERQIILLYSQDLIDEFIEVAQRPKFKRYFSSEDLQTLLLTLTSRATFIEITSTIDICDDPKDNFLLALAKDGKATHLITGDDDLLRLQTFGKTSILTIAQYLK
jgi:putative PIN family toxin of toxin-antitoxin system